MLFTVQAAAAAAGGETAAQPLGPIAYVFITLFGLVIVLAVGYFILKRLPQIISQGVFQQVYFIVLVIVALIPAGYLFGALRSSASLTGNEFGLAIELGGPAALFFLVVIAGFRLT